MSTPRRSFIVALVMLQAACDREPAGQPEVVLQQVFDALRAGDCPRLVSLSGGELRTRIEERGCESSFKYLRDHPTELRAILQVDRDGRQPQVRLIRAKVWEAGRNDERERVYRFEPRDGRWVLVTL